MKTICLDLRALQIGHQNRGIGMHIRSILENLPKSDDKYLFYCFDKSDPIKELGIKTKVSYELVRTPTVNTVLDSPKNILGIFQLVFHRFTPLKKYRPDTFVQFDFMLGMPRWHSTKKVLIGYDLIPLIMKNEYIPSLSLVWNHTAGKKAKIRAVLRSLYYGFRYKIHYRVYKRADLIVCISQASADSFHNLLKISRSKLVTAHLAPVAVDARPDMKLANGITKPYIFYIGGTDKRKSLQDIVHAFNIARGRGADIALVLAGNEFNVPEEIPDVPGRNAILNSPYKNDIHLVGFVTDEQKMGLYKGARAFVFASTFEGFGLPIVEAMSASCPVVTYENSSIPEVAGQAALLVKTGDIVGLANNYIALQDEDKRKELIDRGLRQAKKFTWSKYIAAFLSATHS